MKSQGSDLFFWFQTGERLWYLYDDLTPSLLNLAPIDHLASENELAINSLILLTNVRNKNVSILL